eukprot:4763848-Prymnesium_polylepis.1
MQPHGATPIRTGPATFLDASPANASPTTFIALLSVPPVMTHALTAVAASASSLVKACSTSE